MHWGAKRPLAIIAAIPFLVVLVILALNHGSALVEAILGGSAGLLALRGFGLRRASGDIDPKDGHLSYDTEFEGPEEETEGS